MSGNAYYAYQSVARGLTSAAAVEKEVDAASQVYRHILPPWLPEDRDAAIYEVACGTGILLRYLRRQGYTQVTGSDSAPGQIELARAGGLNVVQADSLQDLARHDEACWERIIAIDFIEHLPKDALIEFFAQAYRALKPDGCLILRAPNGSSPFVGLNLFNDITHYWAYTTVATRALLNMAGFAQVEFKDESLASLRRHRWIKVPLMKVSQAALRTVIRAATREEIQWLNPSIFVCAWKRQNG